MWVKHHVCERSATTNTKTPLFLLPTRDDANRKDPAFKIQTLQPRIDKPSIMGGKRLSLSPVNVGEGE